MLGLLEIGVEQAISIYSTIVEHVFSDKKLISTSGSGTFKASKLEEELKKMVREATGNENTRLMNAPSKEDACKIMVFAMSEHNLNASTPRVFRSYQGPSNQMPNCTIWEALRASMAHPELFKGIDIGEASVKESFIGGDMSCSDPTPHVLAEIGMLYPDRHVASIVCIGAGHARTIYVPKPNPLHRIMPINVLVAMKDIATDGERVAQEMAMRFQNTENIYFRFSADQGMQDVRMSQWQRRNEVIAHTRTYVQQTEVTERINKAAQSIIARRRALKTAHVDGRAQQQLGHLAPSMKQCPAPSSVFTGYENHISQVSNCLLGPAEEQRICVVHGLGGAGKTQLALKVAERTRERWSDIIYVDATSRDTAANALKAFAIAKNIGDTHEDAAQWLSLSTQPWLLVFDNADDPDMNLPNLIPAGSHGSVLVTTRLRSLALLGRGPGSDCNVSRMDAEEAVELLLKKSRMQDQVLVPEEEEAAKKLVQDLGYLALAIVHAGAYIWCSKTSILKYRKRCLEHTQLALENYSKLPGNIEDYGRTVYTTWAMSYERLKPRTQQLLVLVAHLHHDGITEDIFKRALVNISRCPHIPPNEAENDIRKYVRDYLCLFTNADGHWDSNALSSIMDELLLYSLIDYDRVNDAYTLHVLVQDWACTMMSHSKNTALKHTSHLLALSIDCTDDTKTYLYRRGLVLHVNKLLENLKTVDATDAPLFAQVYEDNGNWREAEQLWLQVVQAEKQALGENHPGTFAGMGNLATMYSRQGRWDEAETIKTGIVEAEKQIFGERHPKTLRTMANLAWICLMKTQWSEAEVLLKMVVDAQKQILDEYHPDTLASMGTLALSYSRQGKWDQAEVLHNQVLNGMIRVHGERHPDTLTTMGNLAQTYLSQGRFNEAEALQLQALKGMQSVHGKHHPETLIGTENLASTYLEQGRLDEAEVLQVEVVALMRQGHGRHHPDTLNSMGNLARTYSKQGRYDEAEALEVQVLDAQMLINGELHMNTLTSMDNLAATYWDQDRWCEAEALQKRVLDARRQTVGERHPDTLTSIHNLAMTYLHQGRWEESRSMRVQLLDLQKQVLGEHHPDTLVTMECLADIYSSEDQWDEAESLLVQVWNERKRMLGKRHPDTLTTLASLAAIYCERGQCQAAEKLQKRVLHARQRLFGDRHVATLAIMDNLATTYLEQSRYDEAEALRMQVVDAMKRMFGERHSNTLISMSNLALTYWMQGRLDEAEALEVEVLDATMQLFGKHHPSALTSMSNLADTYGSQGRWDEAEALLAEVLDGSEQIYGERHPCTLMARDKLVATYWHQGLIDGARMNREVVATSDEVPNEEQRETANHS
ncbi:hypothetical protein FRC09_003165 [Ceratobasidium sp. 395]|nr:hypothetical protein FRC09_003165 [Ceratobasidium sp. 395]